MKPHVPPAEYNQPYTNFVAGHEDGTNWRRSVNNTHNVDICRNALMNPEPKPQPKSTLA